MLLKELKGQSVLQAERQVNVRGLLTIVEYSQLAVEVTQEIIISHNMIFLGTTAEKKSKNLLLKKVSQESVLEIFLIVQI